VCRFPRLQFFTSMLHQVLSPSQGAELTDGATPFTVSDPVISPSSSTASSTAIGCKVPKIRPPPPSFAPELLQQWAHEIAQTAQVMVESEPGKLSELMTNCVCHYLLLCASIRVYDELLLFLCVQRCNRTLRSRLKTGSCTL
jgi:hypothetical protein